MNIVALGVQCLPELDTFRRLVMKLYIIRLLQHSQSNLNGLASHMTGLQTKCLEGPGNWVRGIR